jgi:hypothetical protein
MVDGELLQIFQKCRSAARQDARGRADGRDDSCYGNKALRCLWYAVPYKRQKGVLLGGVREKGTATKTAGTHAKEKGRLLKNRPSKIRLYQGF